MAEPRKSRLAELDGFRAIAILAVVLFHWFRRFPELYPYGGDHLLWASWGYLGVEFFFMISGFVIAMTLETTPCARDFAIKRASRLVPPLAVAALVTALVLHLAGGKLSDEMIPRPVDFLPSLTMTDPAFWRWLDPDVGYVDGAYWSLYAEARFYIWAAVLAYGLGFARARLALSLSLSLLAVAARLAVMGLPDTSPAQTLLRHVFLAEYLHFFAAGALFHLAWKHGPGWSWAGIAAMLALALVASPDPVVRTVVAAMFLAFTALLLAPRLLAPLLWRPIQGMGRISYSFYLLHQMIGVALISQIPRGWALAGQLAMVAVVFAAVTTMAWLLHRWVESRSGAIARALIGSLTRCRAA